MRQHWLSRRDWFALVATMPAAAMQRRKDVAEQKRLSGAWPAANLAAVLKPLNEWKPYPRAADREPWESLPDNTRLEAVERGEKALTVQWPSLLVTQFLEYRREGNRSRFEASRNARRSRLSELVIAECVEGKGRFLDEIANGIWLTCEETWWGVPAHLGAQKRGIGLPDVTEPIIDLFAAETGAQLAWVEHLLGPELRNVSPLLQERIAIEIEHRILRPFEERDDFGWLDGLTVEIGGKQLEPLDQLKLSGLHPHHGDEGGSACRAYSQGAAKFGPVSRQLPRRRRM